MLHHHIHRLLSLLDNGPEALCGSGAFRYLSVDLAPIEPLPWLAAQPHHPKLYWSSKDNIEEAAGLGCCHEILDRRRLYQLMDELDGETVRFYGGVAFTPGLATWPDFGDCRFLLPRLELRRRQHHYRLLCFCYLPSDRDWEPERQAITEALRALLPGQLAAARPNRILRRHDLPDRNHWQQLVAQVTDADFQRHTAKVVLSRRTRLRCRDPIAPWPLLQRWQARNPNCFRFAFHFGGQRTFLGCSPERLFKRQQYQLITEALAGTTPRGTGQEEDDRLASALLDDDKIRRENALVVEDIRQRLAPLCDTLTVAPASILKLQNVQHLKHRITARLKPAIPDARLLATLHPTPAVGGTPRERALEFICQHEPYHRGWYAGACGYLSGQRSEFCVAIRSALLDHRDIQLFAGAGILQGSDADLEWQELDTKIHTLISLLEC